MDVTTLPSWPSRPLDSNKGTFGRVLIVAGSRGMSGAAVLAAKACLRGGAGLVRVACPWETQPIIAAAEPCVMTAPMAHDDGGHFAVSAGNGWRQFQDASDVVALGPGLGQSASLATLVPEFVAHRTRPLILDADGLNAMGHPQPEAWRKGLSPIIITPHPGEFGRLLGVPTSAVQPNRRESAIAFAKKTGVIVVLKGHRTIVTDGDRVYVNETGNPGMATAGAGDVLTGLLAALVGQKFPAFEAAQLGVWLHGRAGDLARDTIGEVSLIATDILDYLPKAIRAVHEDARGSECG